jgi:hypothetical protein
MRVDISFSSKVIGFRFYPDNNDEVLFSNEIHLSARGCFFELPFELRPESIHPDLLALSALILCYPFLKQSLEFDFSVSKNFVALCKNNLGIDVFSHVGNIKPREVKNGIPALAYSGGVDSTAALALMPETKLVYFLDRIQPFGKKTLYNKFAALSVFEEVVKTESLAYPIRTDMEYLRSKIGFPVDPLNVDVPHPVAIPALLMADEFAVDAIAYGVIMESVYMVGHEKYEDYAVSKHFLKWSPFFDLVSCSLFMPTAGITEVGTTIIAAKNRFSPYIRSCMRGDEQKSCGKCIKCLRKTLLQKAVNRDAIDVAGLQINLDSAQVVSNIYDIIFQHENIYRYIAKFLPENKFSKLLNSRIGINEEECIWMERWFQESVDLIPEKYRADYIVKVLGFLDPMTPLDISFVKAWDASKQRNTDQRAMDEWQYYIRDIVSDSVKKHIKKIFNK